jgi:branched-chain amino acid transport system permease protein
MGEFDRWTRNAAVYWSALAVGLGALVIARTILRGPLGLALMSVRDSEIAALSCGVPVGRAKIALWIICATIAGLAGAVAYMSTLQVTPDASFSLNWTAAAIFIAVLGGIGTLEGPIIGTIIYFVLREAFAGYGAWCFIGIGTLAIVTMVDGARRGLESRAGELAVRPIQCQAANAVCGESAFFALRREC